MNKQQIADDDLRKIMERQKNPDIPESIMEGVENG